MPTAPASASSFPPSSVLLASGAIAGAGAESLDDHPVIGPDSLCLARLDSRDAFRGQGRWEVAGEAVPKERVRLRRPRRIVADLAQGHRPARRLSRPAQDRPRYRPVVGGFQEYLRLALRSEEHTSELQSLMRHSYA